MWNEPARAQALGKEKVALELVVETIVHLEQGSEDVAGLIELAVEAEDGQRVLDKGILYAPDFLVNAGGLINVYSEVIGYNRENAMRDTEKIYDTTLNIYSVAEAQNIHTQQAATMLAQKRIDDILSVRSTY